MGEDISKDRPRVEKEENKGGERVKRGGEVQVGVVCGWRGLALGRSM
jgi:hypothetical protein